MKSIFYMIAVMVLVGLAHWAYEQSYDTRAMSREVADLQKSIGRAHEELSILKAEWAYLNRPDRLRVLAEMNYERLGLMPLAPEQFGTVTQVAYAPEPVPVPAGAPVFENVQTAQIVPVPSNVLDEIGEVQTVQGRLRAPVAQLIEAQPHSPEPELFP